MNESAFSLGLIGYPLEHSVSPRLHHAALATMGAAGEYRLYPIPPFPEGAPAMIRLLESMRLGEVHGLNVTIPHKQNVMGFLDEITPATRAIGAVNTVFLDGRRLCGENTDAPGFLADLAQLISGREAERTAGTALILGAGGSARAVVYALLQDGWQVMVAARRVVQAQELVGDIQDCDDISLGPDVRDRISAHNLEHPTIEMIKSRSQLIVNTTPVGMWPHVEANPWPEDVTMPHAAMVYDLVYNPPETAFIHSARAAKLPARNGLGMLIEQAALALERWTGLPVPRTPMWESVPEYVITGGSIS